MVALTVLKVPRTSMSMTALKALGDMPSRGAMKLPAAPALRSVRCVCLYEYSRVAYMTKSIPPSSLAHLSAAAWRISG